MKKRCQRAISILVFCFALPPLCAQRSKLEEETSFIRALITDLSFFELAQYEVQKLEKVFRDRSDLRLIKQLSIEASLHAARHLWDPTVKRSLYKKVLQQSADLIDRYAGEAAAEDVRLALAGVCIEFGAFLNRELEIARSKSPGEVGRLEEEATAAFRQGVEVARKCQAFFMNSKERTVDGLVACLRRGILLREHARAVEKDRSELARQAIEVLEEMWTFALFLLQRPSKKAFVYADRWSSVVRFSQASFSLRLDSSVARSIQRSTRARRRA